MTGMNVCGREKNKVTGKDREGKEGKNGKKQNEKITDVCLSVCLQRENHLMERGHKRGFSFHFLATVRRFCLQNQCFQQALTQRFNQNTILSGRIAPSYPRFA